MSGVNRRRVCDKKEKKAQHEKQKVRTIKEKFVEERQHRAPPIVAKTENQKLYLKALYSKKLIVGIGAAGVGKSFLAASVAADAFIKGEIDKIVVARPYVFMGKSSGYKPGSAYEKLYPFVRPMLDTIKQRIGNGAYESALASGAIEVCELESIRGRSFDGNVTIVLDEGQNAEPNEIKSIVTRLGEGATLVVCGDASQHDLRGQSGIDYLTYIINKYNISDTAIINFTPDDIVRSGIVKEFVLAFTEEEKQ